MAKFKDNATGNVFEFTVQHDIESMRKHNEYTEVLKEQEVKKPLTTKNKLKEV